MNEYRMTTYRAFCMTMAGEFPDDVTACEHGTGRWSSCVHLVRPKSVWS